MEGGSVPAHAASAHPRSMSSASAWIRSEAGTIATAAGVIVVVGAWLVGGILGSSCDANASESGFGLIGIGGLITAGWVAAVWRRTIDGSAWRLLYVIPLSLLVAAVPTAVVAYVSIAAWFENCFTLGF